MTTWADLGRDEPVTGSPEEFRHGERAWREVASQARELQQVFTSVHSGGTVAEGSGEAARALRQVFLDADDVLKDVPEVCADVAALLSRHARELEQLRQAADRALAWAATAWSARADAAASARQARDRVARLEAQVHQLRADPDPSVQLQLSQVEGELAGAEAARRSAADRAEGHMLELQAAHRQADELAEAEELLNRRTADACRTVDLRSLRNPGTVEQLAGAVASFVGGAWADVVDGFRALGDLWAAFDQMFSGGWDNLLWGLRNALDAALRLLDSTSLVVLGAVLIAALFPVAAPLVLPFAAKFFAFAKVAKPALAGARLVVDSHLYSRDLADPRSERRITGQDLAAGTVDLLLAALPFAKKANLANAGNLNAYNAMRSELADAGVVLNKGYEVNVGRTVLNAGKMRVIDAAVSSAKDPDRSTDVLGAQVQALREPLSFTTPVEPVLLPVVAR